MTSILADKLQLWGFQDNFIIFSDGSLGFGCDLTPVDVSAWDNDKINGFAEKISQFLNGLPSQTDIQFIQEIKNEALATVEAHGALDKYKAENPALGSDLASTLAKERVERFKDYAENSILPFHSLKIFIRRPFSQNQIKKIPFFSKSKLFSKITEETLSFELSKIRQIQEDVVRSLENLGVRVKKLKADDIVTLCYELWNPTRPISIDGYDPEDARSSLLFTDATISEKGFSLSDMHHRVISLKLLPDHTYASMTRILRELPFDSSVFLTIHVPDQQKEIENLQLSRRLAFSMARGKKTGVNDIESEAKLEDLETLLSEMVSQGEKVFQISLNVLLRSRDQFELENQVSETLMRIRELSGSEGMVESLASFDIFSEFALPNARAKERMRRVKTSTLSDLLPIYGPWRGHDKPSLLLRSRYGSLVSFDPFSNTLTNSNQIVSGGSGVGKSFLTTILLLQLLKEKPKIYMLDIGGSYKKLCENLNGQYLPLGLVENISVNPFDLPAGEKIPSSSKIKFLVGLVEMMTKEVDDPGLKRLERTLIEESIEQVYATSQSPTLSNLRDILLVHSDKEVSRLGKILGSWCGDTAYGKFVDRPTTAKLDRDIVCFDLKGMEAYPELQAVCLYIITDFIWRKVVEDKLNAKFIIFDECWKLLENDAGSAFIGEVFRTLRKHYGSAIAISQNIDDFAKSKVANAILPNSAVKWILMQGDADPARLKEVLRLNDNEMALISNLSQEKGIYSEAFLIAGEDRSVVRIEATPQEYWIATTHPPDLAKIEVLSKENPKLSKEEVLRELIKKYPNGVAATGREAA